jgi:hypothetical protein
MSFTAGMAKTGLGRDRPILPVKPQLFHAARHSQSFRVPVCAKSCPRKSSRAPQTCSSFSQSAPAVKAGLERFSERSLGSLNDLQGRVLPLVPAHALYGRTLTAPFPELRSALAGPRPCVLPLKPFELRLLQFRSDCADGAACDAVLQLFYFSALVADGKVKSCATTQIETFSEAPPKRSPLSTPGCRQEREMAATAMVLLRVPLFPNLRHPAL